jgi:hypothetical protein
MSRFDDIVYNDTIIDVFDNLNIKGKLRLLQANKTVRDLVYAHYGVDTLNKLLDDEKEMYMKQKQDLIARMSNRTISLPDILHIIEVIEQEDMSPNTLRNREGSNILMILLDRYKRPQPNMPRPEDIVIRLIHRGIDINATNNMGRTALMYATSHPLSMIQRLLDMGADPSMKTKMGRDAMYYLSEYFDRNSYERLQDMFKMGEN